MKDVIKHYSLVIVAYSGGKDSSVTLAKTLEALIAIRQTGGTPPALLISSSDTGVENPEIHNYLVSEHDKIRRFAQKHGIEVTTKIVQPSLAASYIGRVLTGQTLPVFANSSSRSCTIDLKINPQQRFLNRFLKENNFRKQDAITLVGTRLDESVVRAGNMRKVGTDTLQVAKNAQGFNVFAPIANMTTDDVWEYIGEVMAGERVTYSDFQDLFRIYKDSNGECVLIADHLQSEKQSRSCGARHGCFTCCAHGVGGQKGSSGKDKSLTNMIELTDADGHKPYAYMRLLSDIQQFLVKTQYDYGRRNWIGRKVVTHNGESYIKIAPDTYSGDMALELFRYILTAQEVEAEEAHALGIAPRFEFITEADVVYCDARWSESGLNRPFTAARAWHEIVNLGKRYYPPSDLFYERQTLPKARYLKVPELKQYRKGMAFLGVDDCGIGFDASPVYDVDQDSAELALGIYVDKFFNPEQRRMSYGMDFWMTLGTFSVANGLLSRVTAKMALTNALEEAGAFDLSGPELYERAVDLEFPKNSKPTTGQGLAGIPVEVSPSVDTVEQMSFDFLAA